jgi:pyruvate dehydrogenase E2 component (dihydrolipoamide acetyltransferase)
MATEIKMPKLSDTMEEGTILRWLKQPGDVVAKGDALVEVETDKADMEVEAESAGTLTEIRVEPGAVAGVGDVIAVLDGDAAHTAVASAAPPTQPQASSTSAAPATATEPTAPRPVPPPPRPSPRPPSSRPAAEAQRPVQRSAPPPSSPPVATEEASRRTGASKLRLTVAKQMSSSKREVPHFYVTAEVDMSDAARLRASLAASHIEERITFTHLLIRALAVTLPNHPRVNASWSDNQIVYHDDVNIGVAVALEDGLIAPVLRRCQAMTLREIARAVSELVGKAQTGKFGGEELTGATFTLTNLGMLDIEEFSAVITQPQAAILAIGAIKDRPVVRNGQLAIAKTMRMTLSADHRVLNGMEAGRFLEDLERALENPVILILESA